jgi:hypothetical protein
MVLGVITRRRSTGSGESGPGFVTRQRRFERKVENEKCTPALLTPSRCPSGKKLACSQRYSAKGRPFRAHRLRAFGLVGWVPRVCSVIWSASFLSKEWAGGGNLPAVIWVSAAKAAKGSGVGSGE